MTNQSHHWFRPLYLYFMVLFVTIVAVVTFSLSYFYYGKALQAAHYAYPEAVETNVLCEPSRGFVADHLTRRSATGMKYTITTPSNYRPGRIHPLLVVWAPAMLGPWLNEHFVGLTSQATQAGFVIVYAASQPLSIKSILAMESIPQDVIENWCIDQTAVFYSGHSDGGTVSTALALLPEATLTPRAIAPSAMGMNKDSIADYACPSATNVMVMHNSDDTHFPAFGIEVAQWWGACNKCQMENPKTTVNGCLEYSCKNNTATFYCESTGGHMKWNGDIFHPIEFFTDQLEQKGKTSLGN